MKKYAILIGNSQFPDEPDREKNLPDLACPEKDVDGLNTVLASERGEFDVLSLKNQPSYQILRKLQRKLKQVSKEDLFLLYYSGHGKPSQKSNILHLTTFDTVIAELETSAISMNRIYEILSETQCQKVVIILDCCFSGAAGKGFKGTVDDQLQQLNNARGTYLVTASTELQVAHENTEEGLSLFTKHLIAGLETGEADKDGDGWVSMNELYDYVHDKVIAENPTQQPTEHVKDRRGMNLPIAKSELNLTFFVCEHLLPFFFKLKKQGKLTEVIFKEIDRELSNFSYIVQYQFDLAKKCYDGKLELSEFIKKWVELKNETRGIYLISGETIGYPKSGLQWLSYSHGQTWENNLIHGNIKKVNWQLIYKIIEELNTPLSPSTTQKWRLPTFEELNTLCNEGTKRLENNLIGKELFPINVEEFWFSDISNDKKIECRAVRPVRSMFFGILVE